MLTVEARFDRHFLKIAELKNTTSSRKFLRPQPGSLIVLPLRPLTLLVLQAFRSRPVLTLTNLPSNITDNTRFHRHLFGIAHLPTTVA